MGPGGRDRRIERRDICERVYEKIRKEREILLEGMKKTGFFTFASEANYIFFKGREDLQEKCLEKGIYIRDCSNYRGLKKGYYRVAVRTGEENRGF